MGDVVSLEAFKKEKRKQKNEDFLNRMQVEFIKIHTNLIEPLGLNALDNKQQTAFFDFWEKFSKQAEPVDMNAIRAGLKAYETGTYEKVFAYRGEKFGEVWVHAQLYTWLGKRTRARYQKVCDTIGLYLTILGAD